MKQRSNHIPDCKILEFAENPDRKNIFDLKPTGVNFTGFRYFRLETPHQPYLLNQGAKYVCESWEGGKKILHTGLIETGVSNYYFGDFVTFRDGAKKNSLMIFHFIPETTSIRIYFFNQFNKKSLSMKYVFCKNYITEIIEKK